MFEKLYRICYFLTVVDAILMVSLFLYFVYYKTKNKDFDNTKLWKLYGFSVYGLLLLIGLTFIFFTAIQ